MRNKIIEAIDAEQMRSDYPRFRVGQNVQVDVRIREGNKERIQVFEGIIIAMKGSGVTQTFTVRKESNGVGVERTFLVNSPIIAAINVMRTNKVRRAKLYYMRDRKGKSTRLKEIFPSSEERAELADRAEKARQARAPREKRDPSQVKAKPKAKPAAKPGKK